MEQDLRTLLTSVRDDAPPPRLSVDDITAAGRHLVRRRRRLALLSSVSGGAVAAVAAVTAAFVIGSPTGLTPAVDPSKLPNAAASTAPAAFVEVAAFNTTYKGYEAGPYSVSDPDLVTTAYQQSTINPTGQLPASAGAPPTMSPEAKKARDIDLPRGGRLVVYRAGAFEPRAFQKSEKVDLRAGAGLLSYAGGSNAGPSKADGSGGLELGQPAVPTMAWQYAENAWAAIYWSTWETVPARDELVAIADGLTPAQPKAFPVGFQPGYVPKGYSLLSVSYGSDVPNDSGVVSAARLVLKQPSMPLVEPLDFDELPTVTLSLGRTEPNPKTVDRLDCTSGNAFCTRASGDGSIYVSVELTQLKPTNTLQPAQIALGMHPEDPDVRDTWPPAAKIFQ